MKARNSEAAIDQYRLAGDEARLVRAEPDRYGSHVLGISQTFQRGVRGKRLIQFVARARRHRCPDPAWRDVVHADTAVTAPKDR